MKKIKLIFAALILTALGASAQINSPYSMYGYGIISDHATSMQTQMGGVGYAMNSGRQINVMNPASYAAIDSLTFLFDMGANFSPLWSSEPKADGTSTKSTTFGGGINYVTMQFPLGKHFGGSMGLVPYSRVGYAFGNEIKYGAMSNSGSGGINQLYLGLSGRLAGLSVGVNANYGFGIIYNDLFTKPQTGGETKFEHVMEVRDWTFNLGAQYTMKWNRFNKMVLGATYTPRTSMHGTTWATQQETSSDTSPDTIAQSSLKNKYYNPATYGAGISYTYEKQSRFMVEADFTLQQWSNAPYEALSLEGSGQKVVLVPGMKFYDRVKYAAGCEYTPDIRGSYLQRITYRGGAYFTNDYLNLQSDGKSNRMREFGVTCGLGFPTPEGKTMVNLGLEWKHRQTAPTNLLTENYLNITLGINFNEVWFWQRKIR